LLRDSFVFEGDRFAPFLHGDLIILLLSVAEGIVPLLQLAGAKKNKHQCTCAISCRQNPEYDGPLHIGLILVRDDADHETAEKTADRTEGIGNAEDGPRKIGRDIETIAEITGRHGAVYRQSNREYDD